VIERVIDSSILTKFLLKEEGWRSILEILRETPYTLDLAIKETINAIWRRVRILRDISDEKAITLLNDLINIKNLMLRVEDQDQYLHKALEIALKHGITIYDALFIAQAHSKKAILITADRRQHDIALKIGINSILIH